MPKFSSDHQPSKRGKGPPPGSKPASQDLQDVRWVYENPVGGTAVPKLVKLQELFQSDFKGFLARKDRLEAQHLGQKSAENQGSVVPNGTPEDENSLKVEALIGDLISRGRAAAGLPPWAPTQV